MKRMVVWEDTDGTVKVTVPSPQWLAANPDADLLTDLVGVPSNIPNKAVVLAEDAQTDRTFRAAWVWDQASKNRCGVDMPKAVAIAQDNVRRARAPVLAAVDLEYIRADETNSPSGKATAVIKKNILRDAPADTRITTAATPAELSAAMDAVINDVNAIQP